MTVSSLRTPWNTIGNRKQGFARVKVSAVRAFIAEHPSATVRQVMDGCGLSSTSEAHKLLKMVRADLECCPTCGGRGSIRMTAGERGHSPPAVDTHD
jgi:SOS-response transcriptional repressor LexA